jgi:two-component system response regulator WspF
MRIGIVNDLRIAVEALRRVLSKEDGHQVAWVAHDGAEALAKCKADTPDLILMDLIMPVMDGVEATRRIMQEAPCPILVVTATVEGNTAKVFEAMGHGALDAVNTPVLAAGSQEKGGSALLAKIATISGLLSRSRSPDARSVTAHKAPRGSEDVPQLIAIGSSTGGPKALSAILSALPSELDAAVVIVQHVDAQFASGLALWLNELTPLSVRAAEPQSLLRPGTVYVAASDDHMVIGPALDLRYTREPRDLPYRPSVDVFFGSLLANWPSPSVAVLLTGMGRDGAEGLLALRRAGWHTIAQDQETSVIFGMPRAAAELSAANQVLPLTEIAPALLTLTRRRRARPSISPVRD